MRTRPGYPAAIENPGMGQEIDEIHGLALS